MHNPKNPSPISQSKGSQAKALAQMHNPKNPSPISQSKGSRNKAEKEVEVKLGRRPLASCDRYDPCLKSKLIGEKEMSKQQVVEFFQTASKDEYLAEKLKVSTSPSSILAIAAEYGYEFTEEELLQFERKQLEASWNEGNELSDEQLEAVAGGGHLPETYYPCKTSENKTVCTGPLCDLRAPRRAG
jgi:predicted ribosomally synthesized peptide with nif11-like leader